MYRARGSGGKTVRRAGYPMRVAGLGAAANVISRDGPPDGVI
jgi:hypothetical protein